MNRERRAKSDRWRGRGTGASAAARPHPPGRSPQPGAAHDEPVEVVQGLRAGLAVMAHRGDDVLRVALARALRNELAEAVRWTVARGVPCQELSEPELSRLADSTHHEGLCVVTRPRKWVASNSIADILLRRRGLAIALDRVRNPYNVGAILRSAAFFGVDAILLGTPAPHPGLAPTAVRVAEGGAEHLLFARTTDLAETLASFRSRGAHIIGADARATASAFRTAFGRPATMATMLVVGNEREGLGDRVRAQCEVLVRIPGSGAVESLNVAVATGVLLGQLQRNTNDRT
jgi:TrmH RNA methyltransferase